VGDEELDTTDKKADEKDNTHNVSMGANRISVVGIIFILIFSCNIRSLIGSF
jgi:hypothetical protein